MALPFLRVGNVAMVINAATTKYDRTLKGTRQGIKEACELLLKESRKIVPIDEKDLYNSSRVRVTGRTRDTIDGIVEYRTRYALRQHEDLSFRHKPGKSAKYLEKPARANAKKIADKIKKRAAR